MNSQGLGGLDAGDISFLRPATGNVSRQESLREIDIINDYFNKAQISPEQGIKLIEAAVKDGSKFKRSENTLIAFKPLPPNAAQIYFFSVDPLNAFARSVATLLSPLKQSGVRVAYMNKVDPTIVKALEMVGTQVQQSDRPDYKVMAVL
jgi:hypothetical protein